MAKRKLFKNAIQCSLCEDIIESTYIHGFVECGCKACFVDGGLDYQRIGYAEEGCFTNLSVYKDEDYIEERYKKLFEKN